MSENRYAPRHEAVTTQSARRGLWSGLLAVSLSLAVGAGALLGVAAPASAATVTIINNSSPVQGPTEWGQKKGLMFSGSWSGGSVTNAAMTSYFVAGQANSVTGLCRQIGEASTVAPVTEGVFSANGTAIANLVMAKYLGTPEADAAIAYQMHKRFDPSWVSSNSGLGAVVKFFNESAEFAKYRDMGERWWNEAAGLAGPYTVDPVLLAEGQSGTVQGSLRSAAGNAVNLGTNNFTLTGPVAFSNGTQSIGGDPNGTQPVSVNGNGLAKVTQTVTGLPSTALRDFAGAGTQAKLVASSTDTARGVSADVEVQYDMQPITTSTAKTYLEKGETFADTLHVSTAEGKPTSWVRVDGKPIPARFDVAVYYSPITPANQTAVPADAQLVGKGSVIATGYGDYETAWEAGSDVAGTAGWYQYVASFTKATQPAELQQYFKGDFVAPFNDTAERSIVKFEPTPSTQIGEIIDGKITDVVTMTGSSPEREIEYKNELYLTTEVPTGAGTDTPPADKQTLKTGSVKRTGDGVFPVSEDISDSWDPIVQTWLKDQTPYLCFRDSIPETDLTKAWAGKYGLTAECLKLDKPAVQTKASDNGTAPVEIWDTGIFTGTIPSGAGVKVEAYADLFYSDSATNSSVQPLCSTPLWTTGTLTVTAPGTYDFPGRYLAKDAGTYDFQENTTITYPKGEETVTVPISQGKCGERSERVVVFPVDAPVTTEKPEVAKPMIPAGELATEQQLSLPLVMGTGAAVILLIAAALTIIIRRRSTGGDETPTS